MRPSRGMGAMKPDKMPGGKGKTIVRKDKPQFVTEYKKGGGVNLPSRQQSKVNAAGNYTKPELRKRIVSAVKSSATQGTGAGQWSARKAQLVAKKYKAAGGGYK